MPAKVFSATVVGLDAKHVEVEADVLGSGMPSFVIVGLPDTAVKESRDRVTSAIKNSSLTPPYKLGRIAVNLAPADIPKLGPVYDLPIAVSILLASNQLDFDWQKKLFVGELGLDGSVRPVNGALSIALMAKETGFEEIYLPKHNAPEAAVVSGVSIYPIENLEELVKHLSGQQSIHPQESTDLSKLFSQDEHIETYDMAHVQGQEHAKRALEIAAAGGHNILMTGSPGSGKTMLARTMPTILPRLALDESLEITKIFSIAGLLEKGESLIRKRPCRSPHHSASIASLVGGGTLPRPGEISLAHRGVLFLDEFAEFPRAVLENLRQPLEEGHITISRAKGSLSFPARFILLAAMNPCPCGNAGDPEKLCSCSPGQVARYQQRISGPILDRIDLQLDVPRLKVEKLQNTEPGETSKSIRERVETARTIQRKRFHDTAIFTNSEMGSHDIKQYCKLDGPSQELLKKAISNLKLSARGYYRIIKVARTIADITNSEMIQPQHIAEAIQYRFRNES